MAVPEEIINGHPNDKHRVVLVGNSRVNKDYSELVDSADLVIRFSKVLEYNTGLVGTKTDVIMSRVGAITLRYLNSFDGIVNKKPWHDCKELWVSGRFQDSDPSYIQTFLDKYTDFDPKPIRYIAVPPAFNYMFGIHKHDTNPLAIMTNGVVTVLYLLSLHGLKSSKIQLVGFEKFDTDIGKFHDVVMDKDLLRDLHDKEYIELVS